MSLLILLSRLATRTVQTRQSGVLVAKRVKTLSGGVLK